MEDIALQGLTKFANYLIVLSAEIVTIFESKVVAISSNNIENLQTL